MKVNILELKANDNNPRKVDYWKMELLKKSIKEFPQMMEIRPIVVDKDMVVLGGNMRWKAAMALGWKEVEVEVLEDEQKNQEFLVKDNLSYGDWNWNSLSEDYKSDDLEGWGMDVPLFFKEPILSEEIDDQNFTQPQEEVKEAPKSSKKAFYLFFSEEDKLKFVQKLKQIKGERTFEEVVMDLIRKKLN